MPGENICKKIFNSKEETLLQIVFISRNQNFQDFDEIIEIFDSEIVENFQRGQYSSFDRHSIIFG